MKKIITTTKLVMLTVMLSIPFSVFAKHDDNGYGGGGGGGTDVPLDGGLSLLLAAGAGYGAKKYAELKKKSKESK